MSGVISSMLELFEIDAIPTDFPSFMYWLCSLVAGVAFLKFSVCVVFKFVRETMGVAK